jgi:type III pantothenate kinase
MKSDSSTQKPIWLLLDIGNTHTVAGLSDGHCIQTQIRFRTDAAATADEYALWVESLFARKYPEFRASDLQRVIISSVVPALEFSLKAAFARTPLLWVKAETPRRFELELPVPASLGADRLANVAGALSLFSPPFLIIDAGTATTFCLVDSKARYIGGAIVPGIQTAWKALQAKAAKISSVELKHPESALGNTTETQLQSGVLLGAEVLMEGLTDRILHDAEKRWGKASIENTRLIATGGCMNEVNLSSRFEVIADLTLLGLIQYGRWADEKA